MTLTGWEVFAMANSTQEIKCFVIVEETISRVNRNEVELSIHCVQENTFAKLFEGRLSRLKDLNDP